MSICERKKEIKRRRKRKAERVRAAIHEAKAAKSKKK